MKTKGSMKMKNGSRTMRVAAARGIVMAAVLAGGMVLVPGWSQTEAQAAGGNEISDAITMATPESEGFSSERLENLHRLIQQEVDAKELAGAVTILARHGKVVDFRTYGVRDVATGAPMTKDTIFRDYSMTKPVTGVAMMILYEQGKWLPWEPITKYIPEFAHLKVFAGMDKEGKPILVLPDHTPTMEELMTHTAGFSYGMGHSVVDTMYQALGKQKITSSQQALQGLGEIPLAYQPGTEWLYSISVDLQGFIVEKLSGQSLPDFMRDRIFEPLGMKDAAFYVPAEKRARFATNYTVDAQGHLVPLQAGGGAPTDDAAQPAMASGGGGLVSTAADYYRFAQMLANGGTLDGQWILSPAAVKLMTTNHLAAQLLTGKFGIGDHMMRPGFGYGYDCAVAFNPPEATLPDGKGTFFWDGAAGTWFWVDPTNDVVFVGMIQRMGGDNHTLDYKSHAAVYGALVEPSR